MLYDKDGTVHEYIDDEIRYIVKSSNITVMKGTWESGNETKTLAVLGEDPFVHAQVLSPSELFGRYTMQWTMYYGFIMYTLFMFAVLFNFIVYTSFLFAMLTMAIYFLAVTKMRFQVPSIQYVSLHEYGSIEGYPLYVPGPQPQSALTFSQVSRLIGRMYDPQLKDKLLQELLKEVEVGKEVIKRLYGVLIRVERQSDRIYDTTYRLASLMSADVIEELRDKVEREARRKTRFWMFISLISLIVGLAIGFIVGSGVGVGVVTP